MRNSAPLAPAAPRTASGYIDSVHLMRGIAAFLVVLEHIVGRPAYGVFNHYFGFFDGLGSGGVAAFFTISGIVLPLSLGAAYRWAAFPQFLVRRFVRIEPTYLVSVLAAVIVVMLMTAAAPNGALAFPSIKRLGLHALYLIPFSTEEWILGVYWTLAIEFQFYVSIGLIFPVVVWGSARSKLGGVVVCSLFSLCAFLAPICPAVQLLKFSPCFALGMLVAGDRIFGFGKPLLVAGGACVVVVACWTGLSPLVVGASVLAAGVAVLWSEPVDRKHPIVRPFWFLGTISYSLYVIHQLIASMGENAARLSLRLFPGDAGTVIANLVPVGSIVASLLAAWLLWRLVELPTMEWSRRIKRKA